MALSEHTRKLLGGGEGVDIEYKQSITQAFNEVLVSFANGAGGYCLFGVADAQGEDASHVGEVVGIEVSDRMRGKIQSRADQTLDKIPIVINSEVDDLGRGVYIVYIPEGVHKPYCTGGGRYMVRRDGQNTCITPTMMVDFIKPRIGETDLAKRLIADELSLLKEVLDQGMKHARKCFPPFYSHQKFGMVRSDSLEDSIGSLATRDQVLLELLEEYSGATKAMAEDWFAAVKRSKGSGGYSPSGDQIRDEFRKGGGQNHIDRIIDLHRKCSDRILSLLK